jgi:WD40 repeat protein
MVFANAVRAADVAVRWTAAGHATSVEGAAFSPDGLLAVSASSDSTVKLWRISDNKLLRTLVHPTGHQFHSVAFAPDGGSFAAGGTGGAFQWSVSDGTLLRTYCCLETAYAVAFSPDGETLAVAGSLEGLMADAVLFRVSDGAELHTIHGAAQRYMFSVLFTHDGTTLVTAEGSPFGSQTGNSIRIWDVATGTQRGEIIGHTRRVTSLALAPDGWSFASGSEDRTIKLWDLATRALIRTFSGHTDYVGGVAIAPDGAQLASSSSDASVRIWDIASGQLVQPLQGFTDDVATVQYSPDGAKLMAAGGRVFNGVGDPTVRLWRTDTGELSNTLTRFPARIEGLAMSADGTTLAAGGYLGATSGYVERLNLADGSRLARISEPSGVGALAYSPDGVWLAVAGLDRQVRIRDAASGELVRTLAGHTQSIFGLVFSPDSQLLVSAAYGEAIRIWDPATGALVRTLPASDPGARAVAFSPDGQYLVSGRDNTLHLWRMATGELVRSFAQGNLVQSAAFAPNGAFFAAGDSNRTIKLWNPATGTLIRTITGVPGSVSSLAFCSDGAVIVSGSDTTVNALRFWRVADGAQLPATTSETGTGIPRVVVSPDDRIIAFARRDNSIVAAQNPFGPAAGDFDADGAIGPIDYAALSECLNGPASAPSPAAPTTRQQCYNVFDADADADIDLQDFAAFARAFR